MKIQALEFNISAEDNNCLANLCGPLDENLRQIERSLEVLIIRRGHQILVKGYKAKKAISVLQILQENACKSITFEDVHLALIEVGCYAPTFKKQITEKENTKNRNDMPINNAMMEGEIIHLYARHVRLRGRTPTQCSYIKAILNHDIAFGVGPAGTGKTYLSVVCALSAFERGQCKRIILARPAVETGEHLGFLPGDLEKKIHPYLRPLYDNLYDLLGSEYTNKLFERKEIEIAPLAYMRGRTLNQAFIILDEAQNTTPEQMKMFLTRIGFGSKAVINGDTTQIDLPSGHKSGLIDAIEILKNINGICITRFSNEDVVRHPLVARIVSAYENKTCVYKSNSNT